MAPITRSGLPYGKLAILVAFAISMPILGYWADKYVPVATFFYGGKEHTGIMFGHQTSRLLMFVGVLGLLMGLIYPRLTLWAGENTRTRVLIVYGLTILLSLPPKYESRYLSGIIAANEDKKLSQVFLALQPGQTVKAIQQAVTEVDSNIEQQGSDTSPFSRTDGFPYDGTPRQAIQFRYPSYFPKYESQSVVVVQLSADMSKTQAVAEKVILLKSGILQERKPYLAAGEARIYTGFLQISPEVQTFTPCGSTNALWMDFADGTREPWIRPHERANEFPFPRKFATVSGVIGPQLNCVECKRFVGSFQLMAVSILKNEMKGGYGTAREVCP